MKPSLLLAAMLAAVAVDAPAQTWPAKPIRWIVGFPPGGGADVLSRMLSPKISEALGQQIIIDNRGRPDDGREIAFLERHLAVDAAVDRMRARVREQNRVAVGRRLRCNLGADVAARAAAVVD